MEPEAVEPALSGVNSSLLIGGVTAVWQHNGSGENELPKLTDPRHSSNNSNSGFRGTRRRPNTQQGTRSTTSQPPSVHGPRSQLSSRQGPRSGLDRSNSPERDELTPAGANGPPPPSIWARPSDKRPMDGRLPPANIAAAGGFNISKSSVQEWLKAGPAEREKLTSAPSSDVSRPSTSMSQRKYTWDTGYCSMIRENMDKGAQLGGLISAMGANPAEPDPHRRPADQQALQWFRDHYASGVPSQRQDTLAARLWLDEQMQQLRRALAPRSRAGSPQPPQRTSSSGGPPGPLRVSVPGEGASPRGADCFPSPSPRRADGQVQDVLESLRENLGHSRDAAGFLTPSVLSHQEEILSRCMTELCGQVASSCLERGYLMYQLWMALRCMLKGVAGDRDTARGLAVESRTKETECMEGMHNATVQLKSDNEELTRMTDTLSKRLLIRQAEIEIQKSKVLELQSQLGALAGVKPELLRQQIADSNASLASSQKYNVALSVRLERAQGEIAQKERDLQLVRSKMQEAQDEATSALIELQNRTPRPRPPAQPPWDLLEEEQASMCMRALREGCSPEDLHRLLIGVSVSGANLMPYLDLLGCCRYLNPAVPGSLEPELNDAEGHDGGLDAHLPSHQPNVWRNDAVTPGPSRWGTPQKQSGLQPEASMASMHRASVMSRPVTRDGLAQTLPLHARRSTQASKLIARRSLAALAPPPVPVKELHAFLTELLQRHSVPDLLKHLPEPVAQQICQMLNHGVDVESTACLLLGSMSCEGFEVTKFKSLAGVLKSVLRQGPGDIGGPITEAMAVACGSTCERVLQLEKSLLLQRRRALKLVRAGAEEAAREAEAAAGEERRRGRKLQRRPHPAAALTALKRGAEFFAGLGAGDDVPHALRFEGRVYCSHMDAREAVRTVRSLWAAKAEAEVGGGPRQLLPDFLSEHMNKKYGKPKVVAEAMYNLLYAASQHQDNPELLLFLTAFMGEVEDTMQEEQERQSEALLEAMAQQDLAVNDNQAGWLGKAEIRSCLQQVLGHKSDAQIQELVAALDSEEPTALAKYTVLFEENAEGQQGLFAQVLRSQHIAERLRFHQATEDALLDAVERGGEAVTLAMLSAAIGKAHPGLGEAAVSEMAVRVFGPEAAAAVGVGAEPAKGSKKPALAPVPWEEAVRKLRTVPCDRKPDEEIAMPTAKAKGGKGRKDAKGKGKK